jgi:RNA polymerase sigma factor (sigma-70 family)
MTNELNDLITTHLPLANKLAWTQKRRVPYTVSFDELQSAAYMGLVLAAKKFNPSRNIPFIHFASFRINGEIKDYLRGQKDRLEPKVLCEEVSVNESDDFFDDLIFCLNPLGKKIITSYYKDGLSMKAIGTLVGVTEGRVSQLIKSYLEQIKTCSEKLVA